MPNIYGLYDKDGNLRYIGKADYPDKRLRSHMRDSVRRNTPLYSWIRKNGRPEMRILERPDDWREAERRLIAEARQRGDRLLNLADGGDEPFCSTEVRAQNGRNNAKAIHSDAKRKLLWSLKQKLAVLVKAGAVSQQTLEKMRARPDVFGGMLRDG